MTSDARAPRELPGRTGRRKTTEASTVARLAKTCYPSPAAGGARGSYLTLDRAVDELAGAIAIGTLRQWIAQGRLPAYRPGRRVLILRSDLYRIIESHPHRASTLATSSPREGS